MAKREIESFISKFMGLLRTGKNSNLNIKSEAGKAFINMYVEVKDEPSTWPCKSRNGPSRQRRREAAGDAAGAVAVKASEEEESEKDKANDVLEKPAESKPISSEEDGKDT